jgi:HicB-like protein involved in pilus formation
LSRAPKKPLKGQFNVRVPPELHKDAVLRALHDDVALNDVVVRALQTFLGGRIDVHHNIQITVAKNELQTRVASGSAETQWEKIRAH